MSTTPVTNELMVVHPKNGMLCVMSKEGDTRFQWDPDDPAQVAKVKAQFDELRKKGYMAYVVNASGDKGKVIYDFDAKQERIIMALPLVGG